MTTIVSDYWTACEREVEAVRNARPATGAQLRALLDTFDPSEPGVRAGGSFWSPANAGVELSSLLLAAGWVYEWVQEAYYWQMCHPETGSSVLYVEGDVYDEPIPAPHE